MVSEGQEDFGGSVPTVSKWQFKANHELKMKANELEKLVHNVDGQLPWQQSYITRINFLQCQTDPNSWREVTSLA